MTTRYRWLLFDADGTLFDFERAETSALARTFAQFDLPLAPDLQDTYRVDQSAVLAGPGAGRAHAGDIADAALRAAVRR